jgi:hypothetical protein
VFDFLKKKAEQKTEIKVLTVNLQRKKEVEKLVRLQSEGWKIQSEHKRGALEWKPGQIDYVLIKTPTNNETNK